MHVARIASDPWRRRLLIAGVALLVGSPIGAVGLSLLGPGLRLAENPAGPFVDVGSYHYQDMNYESYQYPLGFDFVPPLDEYVSVGQSGLILLFSPSGPSAVRAVATGCPQFIQTSYYPGDGTDLYWNCQTGNGSEISVFDLGSSRFVENITIGSASEQFHYALDRVHGVLYCAGADSHLRSVDLGTAHLVADVSLAGGIGGPPMWFDAARERLWVGDFLNQSLRVVDPLTGSISHVVPLSGNATALTGDPGSDRLYASVYDRGTGRTGTNVLDAASGAGVGWIGVAGAQPMIIDTRHGEGYVGEGGRLWVADLPTNALLDSNVTFPGDGTVRIAYDSASDTIASLMPMDGYGIRVAYSAADRGYTAAPAFSAVPLVGTAFPTYVGIGGFVAGMAVLVRRGLLPEDDPWSRREAYERMD
jgi:hypothetical protein